MKRVSLPSASTKDSPWRHFLAAGWVWLIEPSPAIAEPERRHQARLLMAMLLVLSLASWISFGLSASGAFYIPGTAASITTGYIWITLGGSLVLTSQYFLSRGTRYTIAAVLAVATVLGAIFGAVILDPANRSLPFFLVIAGLMGSLYLSARSTAWVFFATFLGLLILPAVSSGISTLYILNALFFIFTVGMLVVMAATLRERYLHQISRQTRQLIESEAKLRELSVRDPLTGLYNRRYLQEVLAAELIRAARKPYPIGIIMVDIDRFKKFNDLYGHAAGDAILVQLAGFLRAHVRASDVTCRYGGEEFILILPEASRRITQRRAEQLREDVRNLHVQFDGRTLAAVTLSLGVAVFPDHGSTGEALLGAADTAMYRAKHDGRDRVAVAE